MLEKRTQKNSHVYLGPQDRDTLLHVDPKHFIFLSQRRLKNILKPNSSFLASYRSSLPFVKFAGTNLKYLVEGRNTQGI